MQDAFVLDSNLVCHETGNAQSTNLFFRCKGARSIFNSETGHRFSVSLYYFSLMKSEYIQLVHKPS